MDDNNNNNNNKQDGLHTERFVDDMGREIAMLVRCNENPHHMLLSEGRAVAALTERERNDVRQLIELDENDGQQWKPTVFLKEAVSIMFQKKNTVGLLLVNVQLPMEKQQQQQHRRNVF